ncbi:MAG: response regulator [Endomicrobia bacterium]|nr:response regulator [Endomicrobiia bacterium]MCL2144854.1 response regulator [Endomicrobiia bacterium]
MNSEKNLSILIADDEEGLRFSLASILEIEGYSVQTAGDGLEALELVKKTVFDIAFFDIRMPGMNGVEAFKKIKEISPGTIVVMMTAYAMNDLIKEAIKEGAFACISKPFEIEDVLNAVKDINSKKTGLVISKDGETKDFLISNLKSSGFIAVEKDSLESSDDFIIRREPELIFAAEPEQNSFSKIKETAQKMKKSTVVVVTAAECKEFEKIKNIKCLRLPLSKGALSEFFLDSGKKKAVLISSETIWSNNLKLALVAKGYDAVYCPSAEIFFAGQDIENSSYIICDTVEIPDIEGFYKNVKQKNDKAKIIFVFDFESAISESLKKHDIPVLHKPFDAHDLLAEMEKA